MPALAPVPFQPAPWRSSIIAASPAMLALLDQIERVAPATVPVLLLGETGTGKDLLARAIHEASGRTGPFVPVNCAALPVHLAESELFGHVRGAFTGAERSRDGLIAQAHHGTLLLDEIGDLDLTVQAKLLRVLEDGVVRRVGSTSQSTVDVRLVCATHRNLASAVGNGTFREDLYHRIAGVTLRVPPLRERPEDLGPLLRHFLAEACVGRPVPKVDDLTVACLRNRPWPGNVRELRNAARRAVLFGGPMLRYQDLVVADDVPRACEPGDLDVLAGKTWHDIERDVLAWAIRRHGNARRAAIALGIPPSTLVDRLRKRGVDSRNAMLLS